MSFDANVLRAMLRLARRRQPAEEGDVALRIRGNESEVRASMRRLAAAGLVELRPGCSARLTMTGLALAVAMLPSSKATGSLSAVGASCAA